MAVKEVVWDCKSKLNLLESIAASIRTLTPLPMRPPLPKPRIRRGVCYAASCSVLLAPSCTDTSLTSLAVMSDTSKDSGDSGYRRSECFIRHIEMEYFDHIMIFLLSLRNPKRGKPVQSVAEAHSFPLPSAEPPPPSRTCQSPHPDP